MASDLLGIGSSGVLAQQRLLQTTSNNIVNVNSQGYVRERTLVYTNTIGLGTGDIKTQRVINDYMQGEVRRDTSAYHASLTHYEQLAGVDSLLGDTSNSVGAAITSYFKSFHSANESPAEIGGRKVVMTELSGMVNRFHTLSAQLDKQSDTLNTRIEDETKQLNSLLTSINDLNQAIIRTQGSPEENLMLFDQRDEAIRQLSEKMDIRTVAQPNGSMLVNMSTGHSLVLNGGVAQFKVMPSDPDSRDLELQLTLGDNEALIDNETFGGAVGGLFKARNDLEPTKRELGQLAVAMADAMNQQNRLGMDLDNEIGGDIFTQPTSKGLPYDDNTGTVEANVSFIAGKGTDVTPFDYEVKFSATGYDVLVLGKDGNGTSVATGTLPVSLISISSHGIKIDLTGTPAAGDRLLLQPTKSAAAGLEQLVTRPEDLALASPLKAEKTTNNGGGADIKLGGVFNTGAGSGFGTNSLSPTAPQVVKIDGSGNYQVFQADGTTLIGTAPASSKGQNLMAALQLPPPTGGPAYPNPKQAPGYEFSITGTVDAGDSFKLSYNSNGFADNSNGLVLAELQNKDLVRKSTNGGTTNDKMTFNQAYSGLVMEVGNNTSQAKTLLKANESKLIQSTGIFESVSGVNLEEEAANLIRFQQSYAASAQIVSTAKTIFDTLLSSVR
ncbi:FlgK family flagellar hook-associated protein [Aeromonas veronii]